MQNYYSLIQYCPDASRDERINVGVTLLTNGKCYVTIDDSPWRAVYILGDRHAHPDRLLLSLQSMQHRIETTVFARAGLCKFCRSRGNDLVLTPPRALSERVAVTDLFNGLVLRNNALWC